MSDASIFPYGISFKGNGTMDVFPAAQVFFSYKDGGEIPFFLLIDSGAHISALPRADAEPLDIKIEDGEHTLIAGISGLPVRGWRHDIPVRLGENTIKLPIVFIDDNNAPRVLGRAGIFNKFSIVFEEARRRTAFLRNNSKEAGALSKILSRIS